MLAITACKVGPDYEATKLDMPASWTGKEDAAAPAGEALPLDWWKLFNDPILTALEEEGQKANADIAIAAARVAEARGTLRLTEADLYPTLSYQGGATRTGVSAERNFGGIGRITPKPYNDFTVSAVLDYEIDLWGRVRRATESARAQLLSEKANADAVRLAVASDIATGYFNLLALDEQIRVTKRTITSRRESYDYQRKQFQAGQVDSLTYRQAEAELATAEAALPTLQQARLAQSNALSILLGRSPDEIINKPVDHAANLGALPVPPAMPLDTPSTLLQRRPDITYSEQQYVSANAQVGVALADYYPTLSLSSLLGLNSSQTERLLRSSAKNWSLGAAVAGPIIDMGRIGGNKDAAKARAEQARLTYESTVRNAFGEVSNALNAIQTSAARTAAQKRQVNARKETLRVTRLRYDAGYSNHLELLDAQRYFYQAQLDAIDAERERLTATVTLYKAMGGGWGEPKPAPAPEPVKQETPAPAKSEAPAAAGAEAPKAAATAPEALPAELPFKRQKR
jgi:multidrug efflux system outer membrane protein